LEIRQFSGKFSPSKLRILNYRRRFLFKTKQFEKPKLPYFKFSIGAVADLGGWNLEGAVVGCAGLGDWLLVDWAGEVRGAGKIVFRPLPPPSWPQGLQCLT